VALIAMAALQFALPDSPLDTVAARPPGAVASLPAELPADYEAVMQAPIFAPDRRRDPNDAPTTHATQDISLIAVAMTGGRGVALFKKSDGETRRVLTGGSIDGWQLIAADPQKAVLERNGQRRIVPLTPGKAVPVASGQSETTPTEQPSSDDDSDDQ
jgi:hypothetical protein